MKRRIVIAALMFAACGSQKPVENPLPPGYVTVGTFTGEVDKEAGTFTVTTDEGAGPLSRTHAVIPESATTVTITNTGAVVGTDVWNNAPSPTGACGGANVTGAKVIVTQKYLSPTFLGAVYAEITSVSTTGMKACNSVAAPTGLDLNVEPGTDIATYGLWSHGSLAWATQGGATTSSTQEWNFLTSISATRFTFSGRIVAMLGGEHTGFGADTGFYGTLQDTGTRMVYGPNSLNLQFIKYDGTLDGTSAAALPAVYPSSLAVDSSRIWFGTYSSPTYVGYMNADGSGTSSSVEAYAASVGVKRIRIDPADSTRAFFMYTENVSNSPLKTVSVGDPPTITDVVTIAGRPQDFVFGSNGNIFVTVGSTDLDSAIREYTKAGVLVNTYLTGANCLTPTGLTQTSGGTFWFGANTNSTICTLVPTGPNTATVTAQAATCARPLNVERDESDNVWAACRTSKTVLRLTPNSSAVLTVGMPTLYNFRQVATSAGLVWGQADTSIFRAAY